MHRSELLREGERLDDLQRAGFQIIQNPKQFCFGMDAVLLSAFSQVREGERVLDLGCGNGVIPILLCARKSDASYTGLEINEASADMARRSAACNGIEDRVSIITGDIREADRIFSAASFDVVTSNPPYMTGGHGLINQDPSRAAARHEVLCTLEDVAAQAAYVLRPGGRFYLVHRPFRLAEICCRLSAHRLEIKRMRLVYPYVDREPNMVLLEAVKGGRPRVQVEKPLIVYHSPGEYTREIRDIYEG